MIEDQELQDILTRLCILEISISLVYFHLEDKESWTAQTLRHIADYIYQLRIDFINKIDP